MPAPFSGSGLRKLSSDACTFLRILDLENFLPMLTQDCGLRKLSSDDCTLLRIVDLENFLPMPAPFS